MTKYCYECTKHGSGPISVSEHDHKCWNCGAGVFYTFVPETTESIEAQRKYRERREKLEAII